MTVSVVTDIGTVATASRGAAVSITAANTKGAYSELIASAPYDAGGLVFDAFFGSTYGWLFDIALGALGSERVVVPNIMIGTSALQRFYFPVQIPAGSRVSVAGQCNFNGAQTAYVHAELLTRMNGIRGRSIVDLGTTLTGSRGKSLDPGPTANTKYNWVELSPSVSYDLRELLVGLRRDADSPGNVDANWLVDVGIGALGAEIVVIPNIWCTATAYNEFKGAAPIWASVQIPAGSRLVARCQCDQVSSADTLISAIGYGGY